MVVRQPFQSTFDLKGINDFHFYITTEETFLYPLKGERRTVIPTKAEAIYQNNRFLTKILSSWFPKALGPRKYALSFLQDLSRPNHIIDDPRYKPH